jgi:hypothetical protein
LQASERFTAIFEQDGRDQIAALKRAEHIEDALEALLRFVSAIASQATFPQSQRFEVSGTTTSG